MPERRSPEPGWADRRLVRECLKGDEAAWGALVDKYKNLVYAIVLKSGPGIDEAADLFQSIWLDAYNDLPKLRKQSSFKAWLTSLTTRKCYHWRQQRRRRELHEVDFAQDLEDRLVMKPTFVEDLERDQLVREAIFALAPRCREMIRLLFFTFPPEPYQEVAKRLGLATGSIGFIRRRCLQRLQKMLEKHGLR
jgi:RNA polymerase sigma factor (sigma-70 family)